MKRKYGIFFLFLGLVLLICPSYSVNAAGKSMTLLKGETATFSAGSGYTYTSSAPSVVRVNQKTGTNSFSRTYNLNAPYSNGFRSPFNETPVRKE